MKYSEKLQKLECNHLTEWITTRQKVENDLSNKQPMFCVCKRLATALHQSHCTKFQNMVTKETVKRIEHLLTI